MRLHIVNHVIKLQYLKTIYLSKSNFHMILNNKIIRNIKY